MFINAIQTYSSKFYKLIWYDIVKKVHNQNSIINYNKFLNFFIIPLLFFNILNHELQVFFVSVHLLLTLLVLRGGKDEMAGFESEFHQQVMNPSMDAGGQISAEQLAYEQQLIASGYPPEYARQYADQHFRPWLN